MVCRTHVTGKPEDCNEMPVGKFQPDRTMPDSTHPHPLQPPPPKPGSQQTPLLGLFHVPGCL